MDCSTPGFPVLYHLLELAKTHVHWISNDIQPSHPLIIPFTSFLQPFPTSGSFQVSWLFTSSGQSTGASTSASVLSVNIQDGFPLVLTGLISLQSKGLSVKSLLQQHSLKASVLRHSAFFMAQLSHSYMTTGKTIAWTIWTFVGKVISLLFNMLSRLVITFLPRSKCLLISWLQLPSLEIFFFSWPDPTNKISHCFHLFAMKWWDWMPWS